MGIKGGWVAGSVQPRESLEVAETFVDADGEEGGFLTVNVNIQFASSATYPRRYHPTLGMVKSHDREGFSSPIRPTRLRRMVHFPE
jgi:hypothetical protein